MRVVPAFDEVEDFVACHTVIGEPISVEELAFEGGKEALGHGVVVAISPATHTGSDGTGGQSLSVGEAGVLHTSIRVVDETSRRPALLDGHSQGIQDSPKIINRPGRGHLKTSRRIQHIVINLSISCQANNQDVTHSN